jgi:glucose/arabinose dehydrogenase
MVPHAWTRLAGAIGLVIVGGCGNDSASGTDAPPGATDCSGAVGSVSSPGPTPPAAPALTLANGFRLETLASIGDPRELAALPNGDLLVATSGDTVYIVPDAEAGGAAGATRTFASFPDSPAQGITFVRSSCTVYVATQHGIYAMAYRDGQLQADPGDPIADVRTGPIAPGTDGDVHTTTSVGFADGTLYAGVGSSCNACTETDPTRATIQRMEPDGRDMTTRATRVRNAIALAQNPATGTLWAGGAGQDDLSLGHPYEYFDAVTLNQGVADYGWPACEENRVAVRGGADCSSVVVPRIELPAYSTLIGAAFYPPDQIGDYVFPSSYRGGLFLAAHGSWHRTGGSYYTPPRLAFVAMDGDSPQTPVDWADPSAQWSEFVGGFQLGDGNTRVGRPTGIAVGAKGSLFVADDLAGLVYRIRPATR